MSQGACVSRDSLGLGLGVHRTMLALVVAGSTLLTGCAGASSQKGAYYLDDGPGQEDRARLERLLAAPDPVPVPEKLLDRTNRPYRVMGQSFTPMTERRPYRQTGIGSWYGKRFHGRPTSTGEIYDMYQMTAAHPTLPLPSYARVRNLENGREVVVRVNDRGPFLRGRLIDLSYLAAHKLGYVHKGHARVEVELLNPVSGEMLAAAAGRGEQAAGKPVPTVSVTPLTTSVAAQAADSGPASAPAPSEAGSASGQASSVTPEVVERARRYVARAEAQQPAGSVQPGVTAATDAATTAGAVGTRVAVSQTPGAVRAQAEVSAGPAAGGAASPAAEEQGTEQLAQASTDSALDGGWYIQLGVFSQLDNALRRQRLQQAESTAADPPVEILEQGDRYQVLFGPFEEEGGARAAAARIEQRTGQRPWVSFR